MRMYSRTGLCAAVLSVAALFAGENVVSNQALAATSPLSQQKSYEFYEDALKRFEDEDYRGAIIQLKNSLVRDPENLSARVLIGRAFLRLGEGEAAETQLKEARTAGADENLTVVPLGRAYFIQGRYTDLLAEIRPGKRPPKIEAEVRFLRGQAYFEDREFDVALIEFEAANALNPRLPGPVLGKARIALSTGKKDVARQWVKRALRLASKDADVHYTLGEVERADRQYDAALAAYGKAIELAPRHLPARISRAGTLVDMKRYKASLDDIVYVRKESPDDPQAAYLHALVLANEKKFREARDVLRRASQSLDSRDPDFVHNHPPSLLLHGVINYAQEQFEAAYPYLLRYVDLVPHHAGARKLLGSILLRNDQIERAVDILTGAVRLTPNDVETLALLGNAKMRAGQFNEATALFKRASRLAPDLGSLRTKLALSRMAVGQGNAATQDLLTAISLDQGIGEAGILLGMYYLRTGDLDKATTLAGELIARDSNSPFPDNLAGLAHMRKGASTRAERHFKSSIAKDADYMPARFNLAALMAQKGEREQSRKIYREIIRRNPNESRAMVELSRIAELDGRMRDAIAWLDQVRKLNDKDVTAQIELAELYIRSGQARDAVTVTNQLENFWPRNLQVIMAKSRAEIAAGETANAVRTLRRASNVAANSADKLIRVARRQMALRDFEGAGWTLDSARSLAPDFLPVHRERVRLMALDKGIDEAIAMAKGLKDVYADAPLVDLVIGDTKMQAGDADGALESYRAGLDKVRSATLAVRYHRALSAAKRPDEGIAFLEAWLKKDPLDLRVRRALASAHLSRGDNQRAIDMHEALLRDRPGDVRLVNNLAILYQRVGDPRAIKMAEQALAIRPSEPAVLDTMGWILVKSGRAAQGLRYLREAQARAADSLDVRLHLAIALHELGRSTEAKRTLEPVLQAGELFKKQAEASALSQELSIIPTGASTD